VTRARWVAGVAAIAAWGAVGCDPCAGVVGCTVPESVVVEGRMVETLSGRPVGGVEIRILSQGGTLLATATSSHEGYWRSELDSSEPLTVDFMVTPPDAPPYRVAGVELRAFDRRGESNVMQSWVDRPNLPILGEAFIRGTPDERVAHQPVEVTILAGPQLVGPGISGSRFSTITNDFGHVVIFGREVYASTVDPLVVDLQFYIPDLGTYEHRNVMIRPSHVFRDPWRVMRFGVGPSLDYVIEFRAEPGGAPVAGVEVEFRQTGGIHLATETYLTVSNEHGHASLGGLRALANGVAVGDVHVRPPAPALSYVVRGVQLETFDSDAGRLLGIWRVGAAQVGPGFAAPATDGLTGARDAGPETRP
jgi:hypothetical protein